MNPVSKINDLPRNGFNIVMGVTNQFLLYLIPLQNGTCSQYHYWGQETVVGHVRKLTEQSTTIVLLCEHNIKLTSRILLLYL